MDEENEGARYGVEQLVAQPSLTWEKLSQFFVVGVFQAARMLPRYVT